MTRLALPCLMLAGVLALAPLSARAAGECDDDFAECKDDCLIQYGGSIRVEVKKQYDTCMKKCTKASRRCTERLMETQSNQLDEDALDRTPTSDQVDADGLPTREPPPKKKKPAERQTPAPRDEAAPPRPAQEAAKPKETASPAPLTSTEPAPIQMTLKKDDGKSAGDDLRDDGPRDAAPSGDEPPRPKRREKEKKAPPKKSVDDDDLRDQ